MKASMLKALKATASQLQFKMSDPFHSFGVVYRKHHPEAFAADIQEVMVLSKHSHNGKYQLSLLLSVCMTILAMVVVDLVKATSDVIEDVLLVVKSLHPMTINEEDTVDTSDPQWSFAFILAAKAIAESADKAHAFFTLNRLYFDQCIQISQATFACENHHPSKALSYFCSLLSLGGFPLFNINHDYCPLIHQSVFDWCQKRQELLPDFKFNPKLFASRQHHQFTLFKMRAMESVRLFVLSKCQDSQKNSAALKWSRIVGRLELEGHVKKAHFEAVLKKHNQTFRQKWASLAKECALFSRKEDALETKICEDLVAFMKTEASENWRRFYKAAAYYPKPKKSQARFWQVLALKLDQHSRSRNLAKAKKCRQLMDMFKVEPVDFAGKIQALAKAKRFEAVRCEVRCPVGRFLSNRWCAATIMA